MSKKKLAHSEYLIGIKDTARTLVDTLTREWGYASLLCVDAQGKSYRQESAGASISDEPLYCSRGFVLRVVARGAVVEHSFSSLCDEDIESIIATVRSLAYEMSEGDFTPSDEPLVFSGESEYEIDPSEIGDSAIIDKLTQARARALGSDSRVFDALCRYSYQRYTKIFISPHRDLTQSVMWSAATVLTYVRDGERIKDSYQGFSCLGGAEVIDRLIDEGVDLSLKNATDLIRSESIPSGEYDCICSPEVTGLIVHEAFGHGVEMDMFVRDRAQASRFVGLPVASELVTMHDTACAQEQAASYFFDDEGNEARDTVIIDRGILVAGISDELAAHRLGTRPSGNGRRESYSHKAYTRMTNTYFEAGESSIEDMIASVDYGFYLEEARCGMEDPKNWGIQCVVGIAREIRDGKLTGRVFSPVVLSGYVPDLLKSISMMSDGIHLCGTGFCGKGYKEWVKVSDGGPAIKARIKLS